MTATLTLKYNVAAVATMLAAAALPPDDLHCSADADAQRDCAGPLPCNRAITLASLVGGPRPSTVTDTAPVAAALVLETPLGLGPSQDTAFVVVEPRFSCWVTSIALLPRMAAVDLHLMDDSEAHDPGSVDVAPSRAMTLKLCANRSWEPSNVTITLPVVAMLDAEAAKGLSCVIACDIVPTAACTVATTAAAPWNPDPNLPLIAL